MQSLVKHILQPNIPAEVTLTLTDNPEAEGISFCKKSNLLCRIINHKDYSHRQAFEKKIQDALKKKHIDLVCTAGFMRIFSKMFVTHWHNRIINIHPSLLPKFKGLNTHKRALENKELEHGCTVHYMRPKLDEGPMIIQISVPILPHDTKDTLAERVLQQEHIAYPQALDKVLAKLGYK